VNQEQITTFCRKHHVARLAFFGSVLRDDFRADSDVDMLVWFEDGATITFFDMADMQDELGAMVGRTVDLRTPQELSGFFRNEVVAGAEVLYAA
jgi:predicted nucleotidyltransferase